MALVLFFVLFFIFIFTARRPVFYQWLLLLLLIDPTGHITRYFSKSYSWGIEPGDIIFLLIIISFFLVGSNRISDFFNSKNSSTVFKILFIFFIYRIIIYGYIIPPVSGIKEYFRYFIVRERTAVVSFFIIIPAYLIAVKDLKTYFRLIVITGSFAVVFFIISILSGIEIVPFRTMQRYGSGNVLRQFMFSYSIHYILVALSIVVYISKVEVRYKKILYIGSIFSIISILISLTKGMYLSLIAVILASAFLTARSLKIQIKKGIQRIIILALIAIVVLNLFLPSYLGFSKRMFSELYSLGTTGSYESGKKEGRLEVVLPAQLYMIKERPLFGVGMGGYETNNYSKKFDILAYDATDISITGTIMKFGIAGMIIYYLFYYKLYIVNRKLYLLIKRSNRADLLNKYKYEYIVSITTISLFIGSLARFHNITGELIGGGFFFYINVGIILACLERVSKAVVYEADQPLSPGVSDKNSIIRKNDE
jgi:hypothetical protein